jgi:AmmeMemoRadiSam system protein B
MSVRYATVSGSFYPAYSQDLAREVASLIKAAKTVSTKPPKVIVVPHAHYSASGHVAAEAFHALIDHQQQYKKIILLGPAHCSVLQGVATSAVAAFETPLGDIEVARNEVDKLNRLPGVRTHDEAHTREHCIEVQLPFLQMVLSEFSLIPIIVGQVAPKVLIDILKRLWGGDETLIVISSDMSHNLFDNDARRKDKETMAKVRNLEPTLNAEDASGYRLLNALLVLAEKEGLVPEVVSSCNSSAVNGDRDNVTGYAAFTMA